MPLAILAFFFLVLAPGEPIPIPDPPAPTPAIRVVLHEPGVLLDRLIALFQGSRADNPAAALASWKIATGGDFSLGRAAEAGIAALNPRMARELKTVDGSVLVLDFAPDGPPIWSFAIPHDDGTFAAFATATALTEGRSEPSYQASQVDRLGPAGSPLMLLNNDSVILAGSREALPIAWKVLAGLRNLENWKTGPCVVLSLDARGLLRSRSLSIRRFGEAIGSLGGPDPSLRLDLDGGRLGAILNWKGKHQPPGPPLDPTWARDLPAIASVAFSVAIDPSPGAWDRLFVAADRVEKADPSRAKAAPIRTRMNLLARAVGVDPESDLWPKIRGVSGYLLGPVRSPSGAGLILHASDEASAAKIRRDILPAVASAFRLGRSKAGDNGKLVVSAIFAGRPLWAMPDEDASVRIVWGEAAGNVATGLRRQPGSSLDRGNAIPEMTSRRAWIWPQRLGVAAPGSPLADALAEAPPVLVSGGTRDGGQVDTVEWSGLRESIRRFLERIPQEPPNAIAR